MFIGVAIPSFFAHSAIRFTPTAPNVFTAGMFIEFTSAWRRSTSPTNSVEKFCGFQRTLVSSESITIGLSTSTVASVQPS